MRRKVAPYYAAVFAGCHGIDGCHGIRRGASDAALCAGAAAATDAVPRRPAGLAPGMVPHGVRGGDFSCNAKRRHTRRGGCRGTLPGSPYAALVIAALVAPHCLAEVGTSATPAPAAPQTADTDPAILYFANGDQLPGSVADGDGSGGLGWQNSAFTGPFCFAIGALDVVRFARTPGQFPDDSPYRLELPDGDVVFGKLVSLGRDELVIESRHGGRMRLRRSAVRRLDRRGGNSALLYLGPNGVAEWHASGTDLWHEERGSLITTRETASLERDFGLPPKAAIEFEISWGLWVSPHDFSVALGTTAGARGGLPACSFEIVDGQLLIVRETEHDVDVARVLKLESGAGRVHLQVFLDQEGQKVDVFSADGRPLASVQTSADPPRVQSGISIVHKHGGLRLDKLRVSRWNGSPPANLAGDQPHVRRTDGTPVVGELLSYDAQTQRFTVHTDAGDVTLEADQVDRLVLSRAIDDSAKQGVAEASVAYADGMRLSGKFGGIEGGRLLLDCPAAIEPVSLPLDGLATIHFHHPSPERLPGDGPLKLGLAGGQIHGRLLPAQSDKERACLLWQPLASLRASALRRDAAVWFDFGRAVRPLKSQAAGVQQDTVYLREGDVFKCQVSQIDAAGVAFRTAAAAGRAPDERVKAVELGMQLRQAGLPADKLERLLTLPRLRKDDPPTHILCSKNGDYLRGRLIDLGDETIRFEVGGSQREFPRARVARIIWLHPDQPDASDDAPEKPLDLAGQVQAVQTDGTRLTFAAREIDAKTISGASDSLGECRVLLDDLAQLVVGDRMLVSAATLPYQQWKLTSATVPLAFQPGAEGGSPVDTGKDSAWVGRAAPEFDLELLGGARFRLSQQKGRIVVLDFWATWCAPCRQGLPKVAQAVTGFAADDIRLVTVNLQETAAAVTDALERMDLDVAVALDHDGAVAEKYGASAIPYTVVVGRDGTVARVFVGAGPNIDEQLKTAIEELRLPAKGD